MEQNTTWQIVAKARDPKRPTSQTLIKYIFKNFYELHGDRSFADDKSIIGGIAIYEGIPVTVIGIEKGMSTEERIRRNFGMPHPEGYRKVQRLMKQAEKFNRPVITIIDTPGAYPGIGAEERGQGQAIAESLKLMAGLKVPIIACILGEGGSGGALALGIGDQIAMFENSIYSILSPEGFASILYKDASRAIEAAEIMKLTSKDLFNDGFIDEILLEGPGLEVNETIGFNNYKKFLSKALKNLDKQSIDKILQKRYEKFRKMGSYQILEEKERN